MSRDEMLEEKRARQRDLAILITLGVAALSALVYYGFWPKDEPERGNGVAPAKVPWGGFEDVADDAGLDFRMSFLPDEQGANFKINLYDHGCGVVVFDYDGDGHDDLYFLNQLGPNGLYRNRGDGTFENTTARAGGVALDDRICVAGVANDYDNDGDPDLYVTSTRGGNVLFRNDGDGTFTDVTEAAGLTHVGHSQSAAFFDYDADGDLDLFLTNTGKWTTDTFDEASRYFVGKPNLFRLYESEKEFNVLYRNDGGTFTDVTEEAGVAGVGWGGDVAVFDFDADGDQDFLVTNMFGSSVLYRNDGDGTFTDVTKRTLGVTSWGTIGSRVLDFDGDGLLDLCLVDMHSDMWMEYDFPPRMVEEDRKYRHLMGRNHQLNPDGPEQEKGLKDLFGYEYGEVLFGNSLFRNLGSGRFEEVSDAAGLETFWPWGIATGDFDNDGDEDVFLPSGMGYPYEYWRCYLLMNQGDDTFLDRCRDFGIEPPPGGLHLEERIDGKPAPRSSRCAATGDFDGDGNLDLVVNNFNDGPYLFRNLGGPGNHLSIRLEGTRSNRDAVGAVVRIHLDTRTVTRQVQAAGGYLSQSSNTLHFGLGETEKVYGCDVRWPRGNISRVNELEVNALNVIREPDE